METFMEVVEFIATALAVISVMAALGGVVFWLLITANGANPFR